MDLIINGFLPICSSKQFNQQYQKCTFDNSNNSIFVGNANENGQPDGIVRVIYKEDYGDGDYGDVTYKP